MEEIEKCMDVIRKAVNEDPSYAWTWQSVIAMSAFDEGLERPKANAAAARAMKMLFDIDMTKNEFYADTQCENNNY
jgi:hypothetical protein